MFNPASPHYVSRILPGQTTPKNRGDNIGANFRGVAVFFVKAFKESLVLLFDFE